MDSLIKRNFFNENILIEEMFWLNCAQDENFVYFVDNYIREVSAETGIENISDVFTIGEIDIESLVGLFHKNGKFGFLCRVGFPTFNYNNTNTDDYNNYYMKVVYGDTIGILEDRIMLYHYKFKQKDLSMRTKENDVKKRRNNLTLVKA